MSARLPRNERRGGLSWTGPCAVLLAGWACGALAQGEPQGPAKARPCGVCHGALGISVHPEAPNLAGQPEAYLREQLKAYRGGKRSHEVMNVIARPLTDADIAELAQWFASIAVEARPKR